MVDDPNSQSPAPAPTPGSEPTPSPAPAPAPSAPQTIDISSATVVDPTKVQGGKVQKSGETITGLQKAGVNLAYVVIGVIATALIALTSLVTLSELKPSSDVSGLNELVIKVHARTADLPASSPELPEARKDMQELARQIADAKQAQRTFWMQFSQMILLNLLLPVLTAILGYVFGANGASASDQK